MYFEIRLSGKFECFQKIFSCIFSKLKNIFVRPYMGRIALNVLRTVRMGIRVFWLTETKFWGQNFSTLKRFWILSTIFFCLKVSNSSEFEILKSSQNL